MHALPPPGNRPILARPAIVRKAGWAEAQHPRAAGGRFSESGAPAAQQAKRHRRRHRRHRIHGREMPARVKQQITYALTEPHLTPEEQAWVDAQDVPPELRQFVAAAVEYWRLQGLAHPPSLAVGWADLSGPQWTDNEVSPPTQPAAVTYQDPQRPRIILNSAATEWEFWHPSPVNSRSSDPIVPGEYRDLAILFAHEFGHALGLQHADRTRYPIMAADGGYSYAARIFPSYQWQGSAVSPTR